MQRQSIWKFSRATIKDKSYFRGFKKVDLCPGCRGLPEDWDPPLKAGVTLPKRDPIDQDSNGSVILQGRAVDVFRTHFSDSVDLRRVSDSIFKCVFKEVLDLEFAVESSWLCDVCAQPFDMHFKDEMILKTRTSFQQGIIYQSNVSLGGGPVKRKYVLFGDAVKSVLEKEFPSLMFLDMF